MRQVAEGQGARRSCRYHEPVKLPARVRLSRLPGPPGDALLAQMRRLSPHAPLEVLRELPSPTVTCLVVIAGGSLVGFLLRSGEEEHLALEATWRGRGIEDALREELSR